MMEEKLKTLYMDAMHYAPPVDVDDFLIAVGRTKTNSVYHVAEVKARQSPKHKWMTRYHMKVYKSDFQTMLKRDNDQTLHPFTWYKR